MSKLLKKVGEKNETNQTTEKYGRNLSCYIKLKRLV
jgi:hypothetical protein